MVEITILVIFWGGYDWEGQQENFVGGDYAQIYAFEKQTNHHGGEWPPASTMILTLSEKHQWLKEEEDSVMKSLIWHR